MPEELPSAPPGIQEVVQEVQNDEPAAAVDLQLNELE